MMRDPDNELAAAAMGRQVEAPAAGLRVRFRADGAGGALFVHFNRSVTPEAIDLMIATFLIWIMPILGGLGTTAVPSSGGGDLDFSVSELLTDRLPTEVAGLGKLRPCVHPSV